LLAKVSDPDDADNYGQFLSREEVFALTATDQDTVGKIENALFPSNCTNFGDSLRCSGLATDVANIFSTEFGLYRHKSKVEVTAVIATKPIIVPACIQKDVVFVSGLTELPWHTDVHKPVFHKLEPQDFIRGGHTVVPDTIRMQYNVSVEAVSKAVPIAVAEFAGANNEKQSDLTLFANATGLGNLTISKTIGPPNDPQADMTEATLDIQYLAAISLGNSYWVLNSKDWMFALASTLSTAVASDLPTVVSVSYAWNEAQQCHGLPGASNCTGTDNAGYINRTNIEFQKVALRGTTVLVASGDSGAHGRTDEVCLFNAKMHPDYPASSPFVTTVGGTQFSGTVNTSGTTSPVCKTIACAASGYEMVASANVRDGPEHSAISSGGGFSDYTATPDFQKDVVTAYLQNGTGVPPTHLFNSQGRGYPDISALAHRYFIKINGNDGSVDGTSAATPVIAGMVGRINSHRAAKGLPAVGFLNPLLYKIAAEHPTAFHDVIEGSNRCSESGCLCQTGFGATHGWDAASGLGTPNFGEIIVAIDAIDARREASKRLKQ
jgi:tripeptidyl-peptidase-1